MDYPALGIPLILAPELDGVARRQGNSRGEIEIVCHQHRRAAGHPQQESLVRRALAIVRKLADHSAASLHFHVGASGSKQIGDRPPDVGRGGLDWRWMRLR